jgi:aspartokinase-like uncharacterized kinase
MTAPATRPTVCKLGGSLLDWEGLPGALAWIEQQWPGQPLVLVVGGGETADLVRHWDRLFQLGEERAHWLALKSLALNENLAIKLWPRLRLARNRAQVEAAHHDGVPALICANCFVRWGERQSSLPLPHTWQVTTDSIAAWVATILNAGQLVLAKSVDLPPGCTVTEAAAQGLVDAYFPQLAGGLSRISWVNLRSDVPSPVPWQTA